MLKIAITGGIGAGKSLAAEIFKVFGIPIYSADHEAKRLMTFNLKLKKQIINIFGTQAYLPGGKLDRKYLAHKIFNDQALLSKMNAVVHPAVYQDLEMWFSLQSAFPYAIYETALATHLHKNQLIDYLITVYCPEKIRIQRVIKRDVTSETKVLKRVSKQRKLEIAQIAAADFLIVNHDISLIKQVYAIHSYLLAI